MNSHGSIFHLFYPTPLPEEHPTYNYTAIQKRLPDFAIFPFTCNNCIKFPFFSRWSALSQTWLKQVLVASLWDHIYYFALTLSLVQWFCITVYSSADAWGFTSDCLLTYAGIFSDSTETGSWLQCELGYETFNTNAIAIDLVLEDLAWALAHFIFLHYPTKTESMGHCHLVNIIDYVKLKSNVCPGNHSPRYLAPCKLLSGLLIFTKCQKHNNWIRVNLKYSRIQQESTTSSQQTVKYCTVLSMLIALIFTNTISFSTSRINHFLAAASFPLKTWALRSERTEHPIFLKECMEPLCCPLILFMKRIRKYQDTRTVH